jgi:zinc/manganese transport system permease protein
VVGIFVVLRGVTFAAHSLAQVGFAGAAGALLLGVDPLWGLLLFALGGAAGMGVLGARDHDRDVTTALVLVASLGLGALFLALNGTYASAAFSLLFGSIVGISRAQVAVMGALALACLVTLGMLARPLLLASVNAELAAARGVPVRLVSVLFLVVVGVAAAATVPIAGTLLLFALLVGPAAAALRLASGLGWAVLLSVALSTSTAWLGISLAYATGWPAGSFIAAIAAIAYAASRAVTTRGRRGRPGHTLSVVAGSAEGVEGAGS